MNPALPLSAEKIQQLYQSIVLNEYTVSKIVESWDTCPLEKRIMLASILDLAEEADEFCNELLNELLIPTQRI